MVNLLSVSPNYNFRFQNRPNSWQEEDAFDAHAYRQIIPMLGLKSQEVQKTPMHQFWLHARQLCRYAWAIRQRCWWRTVAVPGIRRVCRGSMLPRVYHHIRASIICALPPWQKIPHRDVHSFEIHVVKLLIYIFSVNNLDDKRKSFSRK